MVLLEWDPERGAMAQKDLARELGIDKSNVARLCHRMEGAGHVDQLRSPTDGRARFLKLTKRGIDVAREVEASMPRDGHATVKDGLKLLSAAVTASKRPER
jgi:DNA-binding MarR family transcriptional regulator